MLRTRKLDGSEIAVYTHGDGRVFVDAGKEHKQANPQDYARSGPWEKKHFCRFEDYGLADNLVRCRKCGLIKEAE